jgi:hypothetical protein
MPGHGITKGAAAAAAAAKEDSKFQETKLETERNFHVQSWNTKLLHMPPRTGKVHRKRDTEPVPHEPHSRGSLQMYKM